MAASKPRTRKPRSRQAPVHRVTAKKPPTLEERIADVEQGIAGLEQQRAFMLAQVEQNAVNLHANRGALQLLHEMKADEVKATTRAERRARPRPA